MTEDMDRSEHTVRWIRGSEGKKGSVRLIDQRKLPSVLGFADFSTVGDVAEAISNMVVRGAPAIGATGAFGMVLSSLSLDSVKSGEELISTLKKDKLKLDASRPTAVNLSWATGIMLEIAEFIVKNTTSLTDFPLEKAQQLLLEEAQFLADDDVAINKRMARFGAELIAQDSKILHHCNTGSLATVFWGTALGVIFELHEQKRNPFVYVDETRPRLQGAKLTAFELMQRQIPMNLIVDSASGYLMLQKKIDVCLVGADRVCENGDVANKVGTYKVAVCAKENGIPFYPVVPTSTIDLSLKTGDEIIIEERDPKEVTEIEGVRIAPEGCQVFNPAFDITPNKYVTGIITEEGVCYPPFAQSLAEAKAKAEKRLKESRESRLRSILIQLQ